MGKIKKMKIAPALQEVIEEIQKDFQIKDATVKDDLCNIKYELLTGPGKGDTIDRKGSATVHDDMLEALKEIRVHLAFADGAFHIMGIQEKDIAFLTGLDLIDDYRVTGIKKKGTEESPKVVIIGSKMGPLGGIELETRPINIFNGSSYPWYNELKDAVDNVCDEVEQYMGGKHHPEFVQQEMTFSAAGGGDGKDETPDPDFDKD